MTAFEKEELVNIRRQAIKGRQEAALLDLSGMVDYFTNILDQVERLVYPYEEYPPILFHASMKLIKIDQDIEYYILYHPKMVTAYYEAKRMHMACANNLYDHIQLVVRGNNQTITNSQRSYNR